ncbi:unnamed protein product [Owenia fusiformis]|uniref:VWFD domain-containing protein n=1 Tax=Owenia fusiformis TaxID=6347 RepID=A0A8S4PSS0_OWEFU|nr:unnamed protein product [Owenia fusiformis]
MEDVSSILNDTSIDANERLMLHNMIDTIENELIGSSKRHEEVYNKVRRYCETSMRHCDLTSYAQVWPLGLRDRQLKKVVRMVAKVVPPGVSMWDVEIVKENGQKKFEKKMLYAYGNFERVWNRSMKRAVKRNKTETITQLKFVYGICSSFKDNVLQTIKLYIEYDDAVMHTIKGALNYMNAYGSLHKCKHCNILDVYCMNDFCPPVTRGPGCNNTITDTRECLIEHTDDGRDVRTFDGLQTQTKFSSVFIEGPYHRDLISVDVAPGKILVYLDMIIDKSDFGYDNEAQRKFGVFYQYTIEMYNTHKVIVDKKRKKLPFTQSIKSVPFLEKVQFYIEGNSTIMYVESFGLKIMLHPDGRSSISLNTYWQKTLRGICGNFDGNISNENEIVEDDSWFDYNQNDTLTDLYDYDFMKMD